MNIGLGSNSTADFVGRGDITITLIGKGERTQCFIKNVNHFPELKYPLLSVFYYGKAGY